MNGMQPAGSQVATEQEQLKQTQEGEAEIARKFEYENDEHIKGDILYE